MSYLMPRIFERKVSKISAVLGIKLFGVLFATLVFARFSPLIDTHLYLSGFYDISSGLRTMIVQTLAVLLNGFGGAFFTHLVFSILSSIGVLYYIVTGGDRWLIVLMLLLPSSLVWTSIVGKEALFYGGFTLLLVIWSRFVVGKMNRVDIISAVLAIITCSLLRPHYAVIILWLFFSVAVVKKYGDWAWVILIVGMLLGALATYYYVWSEMLLRGFGGIDASARASRFQLLDIIQISSSGYERFKLFIPMGIIFGIVGPLPVELIKRPEFLPFFVEGLFILLSPLLVYRYARTNNFKGKSLFLQFYWWCLMPAVLVAMVLHSPFGVLNPGSAIRWRTNFETVFYMAPLLLLFQFRDLSRK